jgi:hypothetical protein
MYLIIQECYLNIQNIQFQIEVYIISKLKIYIIFQSLKSGFGVHFRFYFMTVFFD